MVKNFKCRRCGECCNPPRLYEGDIKRIRKEGYKDFVYTDDLRNTYIRDNDGKCMFLKKGKVSSCSIYEYRPETCRQYPSELNDGDCKPVELAFDRYLEKRRNG